MTLLVGGFLALLLVACGGGGGGSPASPLAPLGVGPADTWHLLPVEFLDELRDGGQGLTVLEHFPTVQARDWRKGQDLESFPGLAKQWSERACENGQTVVLFFVNWNCLPWRAKGDQWLLDQLSEVLRTYSPACTWLEPVVEPDEGDLAKAERWTRLVAERWPGVLILPAAGAHWDIPRDFVDFHPAGVSDAIKRIGQLPPGSLLITDGGDFVFPPALFGKYGPLAREARNKGVPFVVYTDRWSGDFSAIVNEIAEAIDVRR